MNALRTLGLIAGCFAASAASAALVFDANDADFSPGVDPILLGTGTGNMQTTQQWQFGEDFSVVAGEALRQENNDRVRAIAYVFDNSVDPWTGEINLQLDWDSTVGRSPSFRVSFFGYSDSEVGVLDLTSEGKRNDAALSQIGSTSKARLDPLDDPSGDSEVFVGVDYDTALTQLDRSVTQGTGSAATDSGTFFDTIDLGATAFDRIAMVVWNEDRNNVSFDNFVITQVPEPSTYALLAAAAAGLMVLVRRRR